MSVRVCDLLVNFKHAELASRRRLKIGRDLTSELEPG